MGTDSSQPAAENCAPLLAGGRIAILARTPGTPTEGRVLFTPQQLFGEVEASADVLTHAPFLERARAEHGCEHEVSARLALGGYLVSRLVDRVLARDTADAERDGLVWQLDAVRRHLRELPPDCPESAHLHGITDAIPVGDQPRVSLRLGLMAFAYFLEHEGRLEEALEVLALAVRTHGPEVPPGDFAASALFAGRLNRLMARWNEATSCYLSAEDAAGRSEDRVLSLRARLGRSSVLRGQGNLPMARGMVEAVIDAAREAGLRDVQAMALSDLGSVYSVEGRGVESVLANYEAFRLTEDALQRMRVLGDLGICLREIGAAEGARVAFEIVVASRTSFIVRTNAILELMELESSAGNRMAFERLRGEAERLRDRMPPFMLVDLHYKAGVGLARFGQFGRARQLLAAGMELAETHRLNAWYFRVEKTLAGLKDYEAAQPEPATSPNLGELPSVQAVAVGLREYAAATP
jgi:tetratricopeptide (TPR) repeat protein